VIRRIRAVVLALAPLACDHGMGPDETVTAAVVSSRYVRAHPVVGDAGAVPILMLWYRVVPDDPRNRVSARVCTMRPAGDGAWVCDTPFEAIPVDVEWVAQVSDEAVRTGTALPPYVASDLFLNGTHIRVEAFASGVERGLFTIDAGGRVR
jgi:hypothetical protein